MRINPKAIAKANAARIFEQVKLKADAEKLYEQLMQEEETFFANLGWLADKALASDASHTFQHVFRVYLMTVCRIGDAVFGRKVYSDSDFERIEETVKKILVDGYDTKIKNLMKGANHLLELLQIPDYQSQADDLRDILAQYCAMTEYYLANGILTSEDRTLKRSFAEYANDFYGDFYVAIRRAIDTMTPEQRKEREDLDRALEDKFDELF